MAQRIAQHRGMTMIGASGVLEKCLTIGTALTENARRVSDDLYKHNTITNTVVRDRHIYSTVRAKESE